MDTIAAASHQQPSSAYRDAVATPFADIAKQLLPVLGQRLVAYAAGVRSMKSVSRWAAGIEPRSDDVQRRTRELYRTFLALHRDGGLTDEGTRAWLLAANPDLGDEAPLDLLRAGEGPRVFHAAETFTTLFG